MAFRPLAVITGASTGIGYELAKCCAEDGYDLIVCADEPEIEKAAEDFRAAGVWVQPVQADLGMEEGVDRLIAAIGEREVDALLANAGRGLGHAFLDQDWQKARKVIDLNVIGTTYLIHKVGRQMRSRNQGRILITGSIAGFMPGSFQAVYNGTKAYLDSFSWAIRNELKDTDVTVTCLMPGATDTEFFERAEMMDTPVGKDEKKDDPAKVARDGYEAMKKGEAGIVSGFKNKVQVAMTGVLPQSVLAERHRQMAEPEGE
ncbi:MAG TPA: SDR family NAD(P)-dependent oxidoreductase [Allosphingosinicella sp.]